MKEYFVNDEACLELSKYFIRYVDKICHKLDFLVYYHPKQSKFIVSDTVLNEVYQYYKTTNQIKLENPVARFSSESYFWNKKQLIFFNKEEPYEQYDGEWYYPDFYQSNHEIEFEMSIPNLQKLLLCIFRSPALQSESRQIKEVFSAFDVSLFFPSESLNTDEKLDFLIIKNLDKTYLIESIFKKNPYLINVLKKKTNDYLVEFFNCLDVKEDLRLKDFIFAVTSHEATLETIFEHLPAYQKFLKKNQPTHFLNKETETLILSKSFFSISNLSIKYNEKFNDNNTYSCLLNIMENSYVKAALSEKAIVLHSAFYDYSTKSVVSLIENKSIMPIEKIEEFFCESLTYVVENKYGNFMDDKINKENVLKFFQYFYQNELSLSRKDEYIKKIVPKI